MRVCFYLLDGATNASSYHRALQFFPLLRASGIEPAASLPVPESLYQRWVESTRSGPRQKSLFYALFCARRLRHVLHAGKFDAVVIQRDLFPFGPPLLERLLRRVNDRIVYDTDDATYLRPSFTPNTVFQRLRRFEKVVEVVQHAGWVSAATEPIAEWVRAYNPRVTVVPMAVNWSTYTRLHRQRGGSLPTDRLVLGWTGTRGGLRYLEALAPVLRALAKEHQFVVRVVSGAHRDVRLPGVPLDARPWQPQAPLDDLAGFDVGLVPLSDTPFEQAKFPFKLLQYLALGIPTVCARVGAAASLVSDENNGLLAGSAREWQSQLERLLADAPLRRRLGAAGVQTVAGSYTVERVGPLLSAGLRSVGAGRE